MISLPVELNYGQDVRTHAEKVFEALEALIEGRPTKDVTSYSIAGRSLTRMSPDPITLGLSGGVRVIAHKHCDVQLRRPQSFAAMLDALT